MSLLRKRPRPTSAEEKAVIAYHANCIDGFTSAWITTRGLINILGFKKRDITLMPMNYTPEDEAKLLDTIAEDSNITVLYIVDFSVSEKAIHELQHHKDLETTILDHHKSAFKKLAGIEYPKSDEAFHMLHMNVEIHLINNLSGAGICWKHFFPSQPVPQLVHYVQDYDLWKFDLGLETKWVNRLLRETPKDIDCWDRMCVKLVSPKSREKLLAKGKGLQDAYDEVISSYSSKAVPCELLGIGGLAVEAPKEYASALGNAIAEDTATYALIYEVDAEAEKVYCSLRSIGEFDVSELAERMGGGGHKNAAGFELTLNEWNYPAQELKI